MNDNGELLQACEEFAVRWHEAEREAWNRNNYTAPGMDHDTYNRKSVKDRGAKWIAVDRGTSGHYMIRKADGLVFHIKGYGVPHLKKCIGHVTEAYAREAKAGAR